MSGSNTADRNCISSQVEAKCCQSGQMGIYESGAFTLLERPPANKRRSIHDSFNDITFMSDCVDGWKAMPENQRAIGVVYSTICEKLQQKASTWPTLLGERDISSPGFTDTLRILLLKIKKRLQLVCTFINSQKVEFELSRCTFVTLYR